jgi:hypothetical protein
VRRRLGIVALALLALGWAATMQDPGPNQNAHLALVTSLAHGTPRIDPYRRWTRDTSDIGGHRTTRRCGSSSPSSRSPLSGSRSRSSG